MIFELEINQFCNYYNKTCVHVLIYLKPYILGYDFYIISFQINALHKITYNKYFFTCTLSYMKFYSFLSILSVHSINALEENHFNLTIDLNSILQKSRQNIKVRKKIQMLFKPQKHRKKNTVFSIIDFYFQFQMDARYILNLKILVFSNIL